ncbi:hypothetical protein ACQ4PT_023469 [Festuca glaucescens]
MSSTLLRVSPSELKIPYEVKRQRSCCMQLMNKTDKYVAFKVKTTNPRKYSVRHTCGILLPRSSCSVTVTMQAPKEMQLDYHCKDKFLVQSAVARDGATMRDFVPELFTRAPGRLIEEFKLRVVYIAANPPSPVPEEAEEEDAAPALEEMGREAKKSSVLDAVSDNITLFCTTTESSIMHFIVYSFVSQESRLRSVANSGPMLSCTEELLSEARSSQQGFSVMFVLFVFMSSVFIGHLMKHIKV